MRRPVKKGKTPYDLGLRIFLIVARFVYFLIKEARIFLMFPIKNAVFRYKGKMDFPRNPERAPTDPIVDSRFGKRYEQPCQEALKSPFAQP